MKAKITQYGLSPKVGGWDQYGDPETDKFSGAHGTLKPQAAVDCALTDSLRDKLGIKPGQCVRVQWPGQALVLRFVDRAPESDDRVDVFRPYQFSLAQDHWGDFADVTIAS
jgi:hypothetical protein